MFCISVQCFGEKEIESGSNFHYFELGKWGCLFIDVDDTFSPSSLPIGANLSWTSVSLLPKDTLSSEKEHFTFTHTS